MWFFFFFKQKTAYEMRISDWSSDVCSSDLFGNLEDVDERGEQRRRVGQGGRAVRCHAGDRAQFLETQPFGRTGQAAERAARQRVLVEHRERILGEFEIEARKRAPRAADEVERQPGQTLAGPAGGAEHLADRALERLLATLAQRRQAEHAERKGCAAANLAIRDLGEFERSEEHTSELQSLMRISYAVFCLK